LTEKRACASRVRDASHMLAQRLPVGEALDTALHLLERPFGEPERAAGMSQLLELLLNAPLGGDNPVMAERLSSLLRALMAHIERASEQSGSPTIRDSDGPSTDVQAVLSLGNCLVCLLVSRVQSAELRLAEEALTLAAAHPRPSSLSAQDRASLGDEAEAASGHAAAQARAAERRLQQSLAQQAFQALCKLSAVAPRGSKLLDMTVCDLLAPSVDGPAAPAPPTAMPRPNAGVGHREGAREEGAARGGAWGGALHSRACQRGC